MLAARDAKTGKIDHAANSSNDISDVLGGVVYGLTMRRENCDLSTQHAVLINVLTHKLRLDILEGVKRKFLSLSFS